ncbi:MAG: hypothetical protein QNJ81_03340 [Acidimicrobiia bacterium]|nr:hypothetical protein [Acidimicrobiia bacterium]
MAENNDYRDAIRMGLRRAGLHWLRAGYEVVAGVGALLSEITQARDHDSESGDEEPEDQGPVRIELD